MSASLAVQSSNSSSSSSSSQYDSMSSWHTAVHQRLWSARTTEERLTHVIMGSFPMLGFRNGGKRRWSKRINNESKSWQPNEKSSLLCSGPRPKTEWGHVKAKEASEVTNPLGHTSFSFYHLKYAGLTPNIPVLALASHSEAPCWEGATFNAYELFRASVSAVSGVPVATSCAGPVVQRTQISSTRPGFCKVLWLSGTTVFPAALKGASSSSMATCERPTYWQKLASSTSGLAPFQKSSFLGRRWRRPRVRDQHLQHQHRCAMTPRQTLAPAKVVLPDTNPSTGALPRGCIVNSKSSK